LIVVYLSEEKTVSTDQKRLHERIAQHCALDLAYVHRRYEAREPS
jgi:hypothetical protein